MSKKITCCFLWFLFCFLSSSLSFANPGTAIKELFEAGDYDGIRRRVNKAPPNYYQNASIEEVFYVVAASSPFKPIDPDIDAIVQAIDLSQPALAQANRVTRADLLWGVINDHVGAPAVKGKDLGKLLKSLLHITPDAAGAALPAAGRNANPANGLKDIQAIGSTSPIYPHAQYWLGLFYTQAQSPSGVDFQSAVTSFKAASAKHLQARNDLKDIGIVTDAVGVDAAGLLTIGHSDRQAIVTTQLAKEYKENIEHYTYWRSACVSCSNFFEVMSLISAGSSSVLSFAASGTTGATNTGLTLSAGISGVLAVVFKGLGHYTSVKAKDNATNLDTTLNDIGIHSMPVPGNASVTDAPDNV